MPNPQCTDQEFRLRGRAYVVEDPALHDNFWDQVSAKLGFPRGEPGTYHLFGFDIESAGAVKIEDDKMWTRAWPNRDEWKVRED